MGINDKVNRDLTLDSRQHFFKYFFSNCGEWSIDIPNRFSTLKGYEISSVGDTWVKIRDNIKTSAEKKVQIFKTHKNKPWLDQECSKLANKRKQTKSL